MNALRESNALLRTYQNTLPWNWFAPDLVALVIVPMPPNSARVVSMLAVNSWMASTEGCDTLSGLPKFAKVVSMPSTFTFMLDAPAPGVSHFAPFPTCTTPGTVSGMIEEMSPESPEFFATLRRLVGSSMISRPVKARSHRRSFRLDRGRRGIGDHHLGGRGGKFEAQVLPDGAIGFERKGPRLDGAEAGAPAVRR